MIVIMDMSTGSRLDDEESLPFAQACLAPDPEMHPAAQSNEHVGHPQLGLQLAVPTPKKSSVLGMPPLSSVMSYSVVADDARPLH